jgi:hypothetical protein
MTTLYILNLETVKVRTIMLDDNEIYIGTETELKR